MPTRDDLHKLVDTLPEAAFDTAQQMLTRFQVWPPPRPPVRPEFQRFHEESRERQLERIEGKRGFFSMTGGSHFDPNRGSGNASSTFWEDDALVTETLCLHKGHQLRIKERIRIDADKTLIYLHSVEGPGNKVDQHEIRFDLLPNAPG